MCNLIGGEWMITRLHIATQCILVFVMMNFIYFLNKGTALSGIALLYLLFAALFAGEIKKPVIQSITVVFFMMPPLLLPFAAVLKILCFLSGMFLILYFMKNAHHAGYYYFYDLYIKAAVALAFMGAIGLLTGRFVQILSFETPYVILYEMSSIIVLRTLRVLEHDGGNAALARHNLVQAILVLAASMIVSLREIRDILFHITAFLYDGVIQIFLFAAKGVFVVAYWVIQYIFGKHHINQLTQTKNMNMNLKSQKNQLIDPKSLLFDKIFDSSVFKLVMAGIAALILFLLINRILRRNQNEISAQEGCQETREFIRGEKDIYQSFGKRVLHLNFLRSNNEIIRNYYLKFMKLCTRHGIEIQTSNTTQEISEKADNYFKAKISWELQKRYINVRYGEHVATDRETAEFKEIYRKIKNT